MDEQQPFPKRPVPPLIAKPDSLRARACMADYATAASTLGWREYKNWLDFLPGGALNIAHEAVDRHVANSHGQREALRWISRAGEHRSFTYADLKA